jgi:hypothetical protein
MVGDWELQGTTKVSLPPHGPIHVSSGPVFVVPAPDGCTREVERATGPLPTARNGMIGMASEQGRQQAAARTLVSVVDDSRAGCLPRSSPCLPWPAAPGEVEGVTADKHAVPPARPLRALGAQLPPLSVNILARWLIDSPPPVVPMTTRSVPSGRYG